jgi:hypothetical protein
MSRSDRLVGDAALGVPFPVRSVVLVGAVRLRDAEDGVPYAEIYEGALRFDPPERANITKIYYVYALLRIVGSSPLLRNVSDSSCGRLPHELP